MAANKESYISPFSTRYASEEMQYVFSEKFKFTTWHKLWIALAKAEQKMGLDITDEQIAELEAYKDIVDFETAEAREKVVRHDVMSHVYAYGKQCPAAEPIIHLFKCNYNTRHWQVIVNQKIQKTRKHHQIKNNPVFSAVILFCFHSHRFLKQGRHCLPCL